MSHETASMVDSAISIAGVPLAGASSKLIGNGPNIVSNATKITKNTSGKFYSVAFETKLATTSYPGLSRARHIQEANSVLLGINRKSAQFSQTMQKLGVNLQRTSKGLAPRVPPSGWTWRHAKEPGVMQLVPRYQHTPGSVFWNTLHPEGQGGYSIWGK